MMNNVSRKGCAAVLGLFALFMSAAAGEQAATWARDEAPESVIMRWPPRSRTAAALMLEKYGDPDQFDRNTLAWFNKGEWKRIVVHRSVSRGAAGKTRDYLAQTVGYLVPGDKIEDLKRFSPMLMASLTAGELTAASDSEAKNRLALNLADEIIQGKRGVADARAHFLKTSRLAASGKASVYLDRLLFNADNALFMAPTGADR